jgi:hypothetical protein
MAQSESVPTRAGRPASRARRRLLLLNALGGAAVLGSYALTFSRPDAGEILWGGVPESLKPLYTRNMFLAAAGYFPFTALLAFGVDPARVRFFGRWGYGLLFGLYFLVLIPSALWLPLTFAFADSGGSMALWWAVRVDLALVAVGSLGLLGAVWTASPPPNRALQVAAVVGALAFCLQTVVLDAAIWPAYYPLP